ncbi:MAG: DinB family protein [Bryobacteraceae bacterium]
MLRLIAGLSFSLIASLSLLAQNPQSDDVRSVFGNVKKYALASAEKMPEEHYGFQPTPDVRTFAALLGHIADSNYSLCASAKPTRRPEAQVEKSMKTKQELIQGLKDAFAFCDAAYNALTDANGAEMVKLFGRDRTRAGALNFNNAHSYEHYGNLVTYMRMKGLVPPSSEGRR